MKPPGMHMAWSAAAGAGLLACLPTLAGSSREDCRPAADGPNPCGLSHAAPWAMFHRNARHTGSSPYVGTPTATLKWTFETGAGIHATPSIGPDGTIYVASHDRNLYAMAPDGRQRWALAIGEAHGSVAIRADGILYAASEEVGSLFLYAVNPDGTVRWTYPIGDAVHASPTVSDNGTVYFCAHDRKVYAVAPDGTLRWTVVIGQCHTSPALAADGTIYVGSEETNRLYALRVDGVVLWEYEAGGPIESSPAVGADGTLYFGANDGKVYALNPDGSERWIFATDGSLSPSPGIGAVFSSPAISDGRSTGGPGCAPGVILVGARDKNLYALSPDGVRLWAYAAGASIMYSSPTVGQNGMTYVGARDGKLYAVDCEGNLKWSFATGAAISSSSAAIGSDGTIYFGSDDGRLYALGI